MNRRLQQPRRFCKTSLITNPCQSRKVIDTYTSKPPPLFQGVTRNLDRVCWPLPPINLFIKHAIIIKVNFLSEEPP